MPRHTLTLSWSKRRTTERGRPKLRRMRRSLARPPARLPGTFSISRRCCPKNTKRALKTSWKARLGARDADFPGRVGIYRTGKRGWLKKIFRKPSEICSSKWGTARTRHLPKPGSGSCLRPSTFPRKRASRRRRPPFPPFHPSPQPLTKSKPRHRKRNSRQRLLSHRWMLWARL